MSDTFKDRDGDQYRAFTSGHGKGALIDIVANGDEAISFYAADAHEIIRLIERAAEEAA